MEKIKDFNPRSHERSDALAIVPNCGKINFNPRSHERSDTGRNNRHQGIQISIHAPTRGATQGTKIFKTLLYNFNPRSHERSDALAIVPNCGKINFNPRSHERSDKKS